MAADPVIPIPGLVTEVTTGGDAVTVFAGGPNGGFITNPPDALEYLYVNPIDAATLTASGSTFAIPPGGSWPVIPGQTTPTSVNAPDNGHTFSAVSY